ncbi:hypothetical protein BY458DRAFT_488837 [Sporodiniella umbellata]|nr:hypothetical protein BY458DRAFT_488837 [Sporodiniella umbellata]
MTWIKFPEKRGASVLDWLQTFFCLECDPMTFPNVAFPFKHRTQCLVNPQRPREASSTIVKLVNSKNINQGMLALTLLDNCVKNCGYPFQLQIATKEFLNELVRRFPERPAPFPSPVIQRILYLIKEWKVALTEMSKHKDDLIHIKDMYRLLRFKGYRFPELKDASVAALAPSDALKSAHELEEEDRLAQSAVTDDSKRESVVKLQELIRRGRPQDLVEANQLMKIMSGYDTRQVPDYSQKFEDELHKVQDKTILLYEMLETVRPGENVDKNEMLVDLKNSCASAQPKLQKLITEEEDTEKIGKALGTLCRSNSSLILENLLVLNDMINNALAKFADVRKGLFDTHYEIRGKPPTTDSVHTEPKQAISLIDLEDATSLPTTALNDLSDLFGAQTTVTSPKQSNDLLDLLGQPPAKTDLGSPSTATVTSLVNKNGLHIELEIRSIPSSFEISAYYSNASTAPMERLMLKLAAPKSMQIKMDPQSSATIQPKSNRSVHQTIRVNNPHQENLRLRYKVSYEQFGVEMELAGEYHHS